MDELLFLQKITNTDCEVFLNSGIRLKGYITGTMVSGETIVIAMDDGNKEMYINFQSVATIVPNTQGQQ